MATQPCPCGHFGNPRSHCRCSPDIIRRYLGKISGPLLDRIDLQVEVPLLTEEQLTQGNPKETATSADYRQQVLQCQKIQLQRQEKLNADLESSELDSFAPMTEKAQQLLSQSLKQLNLSARSYHRIIKVARTIADLSQTELIEPQHISETLSFRKLERYLAQLP